MESERVRIRPVERTWWTERDLPAEFLNEELKLIGGTAVFIEWYNPDDEQEGNVVRISDDRRKLGK